MLSLGSCFRRLPHFGTACWLAAFFAFLSVSQARADAVYTYTGNSFTEFFGTSCPSRCQITGSFTLADPLAPNLNLFTVTPLSFSFTDGVGTVDSSNSAISPLDCGPQKCATVFIVDTDASGNIVGWNNIYSSASFIMFSSTNPPGCNCVAVDSTGDYVPSYFADVKNNPGTWALTVTQVTPEPSTLCLLATGILGVGALFRSR